MKLKVGKGKGTRPVGSPEETAFLDLLRTTDMLSRGLDRILKTEDVSSTQYNVLRILRGSPAGLPCGEIGSRIIPRDPDFPPLPARLKNRGLTPRPPPQKTGGPAWAPTPQPA